jgi:hypothetical protein
MKSKGIGQVSAVLAAGAAASAVVAGTEVYLVRELMTELLFFCILFAAMGIAVAIFLVIDAGASRAFLWVRAQIIWAHIHLRHATAVRCAASAIHKS